MVRSPVPSCPQNCQKKKTKKKRKENNKGKKQRKRQDFPAGEPQPLSPKPTPSPTIPACSAGSITHFSTLLPRSLLLYSYPPPSTSEVAGCRLAGGAGAGDELDSMLLTFSLTNAYKHRLHPPYTKHTCMLAIRHRLSPACHPTLTNAKAMTQMPANRSFAEIQANIKMPRYMIIAIPLQPLPRLVAHNPPLAMGQTN